MTPAFEVVADPQKISAYNLTLNDLITTVGASNTRAPGGIAYEQDRETQIDIRGDITSPESILGLPISAPGSNTSTPADRSGSVDLRHPGAARRRCGQRYRRVRATAPVRVDQRHRRPLHAGPKGVGFFGGHGVRQRPQGAAAHPRPVPGHQLQRHQRPVQVHRAADRRRRPHPVRGHRADRHRDVVLPGFVAQRNRRTGCDPGLAVRRAVRHEAHGPDDRYDLAAGHDAGGRDPGRRLDRRAGKHRAPLRDGAAAGRGRGHRSKRDRDGRDRHHAGRRGRLPADRLSPRSGRTQLGRVRHRGRHLDPDLTLRIVHDHAVAGRELGAQGKLEAAVLHPQVRARLQGGAQLVRASRAAVGLACAHARDRILPAVVRRRDATRAVRHRRLRVRAAGRPWRDLLADHLSGWHAALDDDQRGAHVRARDSRSSPTSTPIRRFPAVTRHRSAASSSPATSVRFTSGSKTIANTIRSTG